MILKSGERIPSCLRQDGVSEQNTKKVLDGFGFPAALRRGVSIIPAFIQEDSTIKFLQVLSFSI
jgi:hypothetical protein